MIMMMILMMMMIIIMMIIMLMMSTSPPPPPPTPNRPGYIRWAWGGGGGARDVLPTNVLAELWSKRKAHTARHEALVRLAQSSTNY